MPITNLICCSQTPLIYLFIYLFVCLFIYLFIYLFIHSSIHRLSTIFSLLMLGLDILMLKMCSRLDDDLGERPLPPSPSLLATFQNAHIRLPYRPQ